MLVAWQPSFTTWLVLNQDITSHDSGCSLDLYALNAQESEICIHISHVVLGLGYSYLYFETDVSENEYSLG